MLDFYKGIELSHTPEFYWEESIQDDLESFFEKLKIGNEKREDVVTYFLPKLTNEELKLVELKDEDHLQQYVWHIIGRTVDVDPEEMKKSESDSKYVLGWGRRETFTIENSSNSIEELN